MDVVAYAKVVIRRMSTRTSQQLVDQTQGVEMIYAVLLHMNISNRCSLLLTKRSDKPQDQRHQIARYLVENPHSCNPQVPPYLRTNLDPRSPISIAHMGDLDKPGLRISSRLSIQCPVFSPLDPPMDLENIERRRM